MLVERIKPLTLLDNKFQLVKGLEELIEDCKGGLVQCDKPSMLLLKYIYRTYTS
jgi:hypothetical protein